MLKNPLTVIAAVFGLTGTALADVPRVATDIAPIHGLVARVMQGVGTPDLVIPAGASPHGHTLRPSEARSLAQADLVFWLGEALTPWMHGAVEELASGAGVIELLETDGTLVLPFRQGVSFEAHDHDDTEEGHEAHAEIEEGHEHEEGHEEDHKEDHHDGHGAHDGIDPHAWLAPANGGFWLDVIAGELAQLDPENATLYATNADAGKAEIHALEEQLSAALAPVRQSGFVVFHDAYQYFEQSFELQAAGAISLSDASAPSPARIAEIQKVVADNQVNCVFSEPQFNPDLVATVLEGSQAQTVVIDPMGTNLELGAGFYLALLQQLGNAMASCR